jgi:hypothetical protein
MSVRIRVFDDEDRLVAAATSFGADGGLLLPSSDSAGFFAYDKIPLNETNSQKLLNQPVPAGTMLLEYRNLAGLYNYVEMSSATERLRAATLFSTDYGIWGNGLLAGAYDGSWTVMVDFVNWYRPTVAYQPAPALLQGESPYFFPYNHLGPYAQNGYLSISNAPLSGGASAEFEVDRRGYEQGIILGMNWDDETRTMSWVRIQIVDNTGYQYYWYSWDGWFDGYLNAGPYQVTITEWNQNDGHVQLKTTLNVNTGEQNTALNFILEESQIPIPELALTPFVFVISVGATSLLLAQRRKQSHRAFREKNRDWHENEATH